MRKPPNQRWLGGFFHVTTSETLESKGYHPLQQLVLGAALVSIGTVIGALSSDNTKGTANAQFAPPSVQSGDALWHLPRFGEQGWFLHANNGRVRACNMDKVSVVDERAAPRCSKWTVD